MTEAASAYERRQGRRSPSSYLKHCPKCTADFADQTFMIATTHVTMEPSVYPWTCVACEEWLDCWWMIDSSLPWIELHEEPTISFEMELMHSPEDITPDTIQYSMELYCLCCDLPAHRCEKWKDNNKGFIGAEDPEMYRRENKISWADIYETEYASKCTTCVYFKDTGCFPLRNVIRYHHDSGVLPAFSLSVCDHYDENQEVIDFDDMTISYSENPKGDGGLIVHFGSHPDDIQ